MRAVAQRRSLFDDPAEEINEMTAIIKQSITHLNTEVKDLKQRAAGEADAGSRQSQQHSKGVITSLQSTLKKTTADFMTVVKQRRQNVADQEERKSQFGASSVPRERPHRPPAPGHRLNPSRSHRAQLWNAQHPR